MNRHITPEKSPTRCPWVGEHRITIRYHDAEWGVPLHDDTKLFEFLVLEGAEAGLSWHTVLNKRAAYRKAFVGFDPRRVSKFGTADVRRLLGNAGIIRNRMKILSAINNAARFLEVQKECDSFDRYMWKFSKTGKPIQHRIRTARDYLTRDETSDALSRNLKKRGFSFVGTTIMYAHMQATGMVNDHAVSCFRHAAVARMR